ncbi:hypothetical protein B0T26DRAFT_802163 [Lasiosphaeria miniovina]|uniref:Uncharacterized protein n=1 Tax=Lasiosphaeria miniovina TaxID=1954250 RepID=A0AA40AJ87_9PEZI|nr:uncharacterized protein B0T26DRAFT_802163 [Lasiosphaeria miniovina]KAK0716862.1 hypothetical protein B0T26DRAFT_802163 [Lasiosphaeria miniovina]
MRKNATDQKEAEYPESKASEPRPRPASPRSARPSPERGWQFDKAAEFPWRLKQVVEEESNWRGIWVLEVKDMQAMVWETVHVPKESGYGGKHQRVPTMHLPFTPERERGDLSAGGQDNLMITKNAFCALDHTAIAS